MLSAVRTAVIFPLHPSENLFKVKIIHSGVCLLLVRHCYIGPVYPTAKWRSRRVRVKGVTQVELRKMQVVELLPYISANFGWIRNGGPQPSRASVKSEFCEIKDVPTAKWWLSTVLILKVKEYSCQHKGLTMTITFQQLKHKRYLFKQPR